MIQLHHYLKSLGKRILFRPVTASQLINIRAELQAMTESLSKPVNYEIGEAK